MSGPGSDPPATPGATSPLDVFAQPKQRRYQIEQQATPTVASVTAARSERLRQERETFDQRKVEASAWSRLRLVMGWTSVFLLLGLCAASVFVLFAHRTFPAAATAAAASTVLVQTVAVVVMVWRLVIGTGPPRLSPVTGESEPRSVPGADEIEISG